MLRPSLKPGTVLIILAGRFRGKRVVYLKPLENGVLLVTGPFKINGVPLRRVNSRYVIATSTSVDLEGVDVGKFDDKYFAREKEAKKTREQKLFKGDKVAVCWLTRLSLDSQQLTAFSEKGDPRGAQVGPEGRRRRPAHEHQEGSPARRIHRVHLLAEQGRSTPPDEVLGQGVSSSCALELENGHSFLYRF